MLAQYQSVYKMYIDLHQQLTNANYELHLRDTTTVPTMQVEINRLHDCLERELGEKAILEQKSPESSPCPACVEKKRLLDFLRGRCSHNTDRTLALEDMRLTRAKIDELEKEVRILQSRVAYFHTMSTHKANLFWRDEEVRMLREQLEGRTNQLATKLNEDPASFRNLDAEVLALGRMHAGAAQDQRAEISELRLRTDAERSELTARCAKLETEIADSSARYQALRLRVARRSPLKAVLHGALEPQFRAFFEVVPEGCECLDENTIYDAFFGGLSGSDRSCWIEWMYSCCNRPRRRGAGRAGKKLLAACLWAIGGVYKSAQNGWRYVWVNLRRSCG